MTCKFHSFIGGSVEIEQCKECQNTQNKICQKCGEEYESYRDGYCEDCEADDDIKSLEDRLPT